MSGSKIIVPIALVICTSVASHPAAGQCQLLEAEKLLAGDGGSGDRYGGAVAINGDFAFIAARGHSHDEENTGAVYVLRFDGTGWREVQELLPDAGSRSVSFGSSIDLFGDTLVVGTIGDEENGDDAGAVYVFRRDGGNWRREAKLLADDGGPRDLFGWEVAVWGDTVVAATWESGQGKNAGSVYAFRFDGSNWRQEAKLPPDDIGEGEKFGASIDVQRDTLVVGTSHFGAGGSVHVFGFNGREWARETVLRPDEVQVLFGAAVALFEDMLLVGGGSHVDGLSGAGAVHLFRRKQGQLAWVQEAKFVAWDARADDHFGQETIAVAENLFVVSAAGRGDGGPTAGAVYVFRRIGLTWTGEAKLLASDREFRDMFSSGIATDGDTILIGARGDDEQGSSAGAAYIFDGVSKDCNGNGGWDRCDVGRGVSGDCNANDSPDECDLTDGTSKDVNENGFPDECEGACCDRDGTCVENARPGDCRDRFLLQAGCADFDPPCEELVGACCRRDGTCTDDTPGGACDDRFVPGLHCVSLDPPCGMLGACCDRIGECVDDVRLGDCNERFEPLAFCEDLEPACGSEMGACCVAGDCLATNGFAECEARSGFWFEGETCDGEFECPLDEACPTWDNDIEWNWDSGRAISPPNFPDIRVADDFAVPEGGCAVQDVQLFVFEDAGWTDGGDITITIYADSAEGGPGATVARVTTYFDREPYRRDCGFGNDCYIYLVSNLDISLPGGTYWLGVRNQHGSGSGTNYWMTSDGGEDGGDSDTGWFSLNAGQTWSPEGANWHHAFTINQP